MRSVILQRNRRGLISIEFITALMLLLATVLLFLNITSKRIRISKRLADDRAAVRLAEQTFLTLRTNGYVPGMPVEGAVISKLNDSAPPAHVWIEVNATVDARNAALVGLVPVKEVP